jgi:phage tail-like protein
VADPRRAIFRITGPDIEQDTVEVADGKTLKLGRLAANDLTLKHQKISRYHAEITLDDKGLFVTDLGSSNGTRVGDTPLEPEKPFQLNEGDSIQLGPFVLTVDEIIEPEVKEEPPPLDKTVESPAPQPSHLEPTRAVSTEAVQEAVAKAEEEKAKAKATEKIEPEEIQEEPEADVEDEAEPEEAESEEKPSKRKGRRKKSKEEVPPEPEPEAEEEEEEKPEVVAEHEEPTVKPDEAPAEEEAPPEVTPDQATIAAQGTEPQPEVEEAQEAELEPEPKKPAPEPEKPKAAEKFKPPPPTIPPRVPLPVLADGGNGVPPVPGVPTDASSWMQYLPAIYSDDLFTGRFLLIFESIAAPLEWIVDHFDFFLDARYAPPEWLHWFGSWADILVPNSIPEARQRQIVAELSDLYKARGTPKSLSRHLELVFNVKPDIKEPKSKPSTFEVVLKLGKTDDTDMNRKLATRIIEAHRPAHTQFTLTIK